MKRLFAALLVLGVASYLPAATPDANWPAFLGGGAAAENSIPLTWSATSNVQWQTDLVGYGQSSPIVWGDRVFLTSIEGPMKEKCHVLALNLHDGKLLWRHSFDSSTKAENNSYISKAAPTPVTDGKLVYAFFESGDIVALTFDGKESWKHNVAAECGELKTRHGLAASPVQAGEAVILLVDHDGPSYLLALSKKTGELLWKTERESRTSWSSPALLTIAGQPTVVCSSNGTVDGYSPVTGQLLWSFDEVDGNTSNTPLASADGSFLIGAGTGQKTNLALRVELVAGKPVPNVTWSSSEASSSFGSPIVHAGHAYFVNKVGVLYCLDAKTGEVRYTQRLPQTCWATPLGVADRVYFFGKSGKTTVLAAGPEYRLLAENDLWDAAASPAKPAETKPAEAKPAEAKPAEAKPADSPAPAGAARRAPSADGSPVLYGVAVAGDRLLIRRGDRLYCVHPSMATPGNPR